MATATAAIPNGTAQEMSAHASNKRNTCEEIATALGTGKVGDIVSKHEKLILQYYEDVQKQATESFRAAKLVSYLGFSVLIVT